MTCISTFASARARAVTALHPWRQRLAAWGRALAASWRHAAARREFERLDTATWRDLGLGPSEFSSYWAEAHGRAERTRRRLEPPGCG